jgi:SAM-dependent methyltransferase
MAFGTAKTFVERAINRTGNRHEDPICGRSFRRFASGPRRRPDAYCPACRSAERHRVLYRFLERQTTILDGPARVLHVGPEPGIGARLQQAAEVDYVSTDLDPTAAMVAADLTDLPFEDASFDYVLCNHVLEHIPDDVAAMSELRRVLDAHGMAVMQHPIDANRGQTFEDWTVADSWAREQTFYQRDHVRIYGRDFANRLAEAGFAQITRTKYQDELPAHEIERYCLEQQPSDEPTRDIEADVIYTASPAGSSE